MSYMELQNDSDSQEYEQVMAEIFPEPEKNKVHSCGDKFSLFKAYEPPARLKPRKKIDFAQVLGSVSQKRNSYEKVLLSSLFVQIFLASFMSFTLSYIFHSPVFVERNPVSGAESAVSEKDYCLDPSKYFIKEQQFQSLILKFQLYCDRRSKADSGLSMIFLVGASFGALVMTLGDRIGRKKTYNLGLVLIIIGFLSGILFDTYWTIILGYGLAMAGGDIVFSLAFIYLNESLGTRLRIMSNALMFSAFSLGEIVFSGGKFFVFNDYQSLLVFNLACGVLTFVPAYFNLESPMFLNLTEKNRRALFSWLVCVSRRNGLNRGEFEVALQDIYDTSRFESKGLLQTSEGKARAEITDETEANLETETLGHNLVAAKESQYACSWEDIRSLILISLVFANTYIIYQATLYSSSTIGVSDARINGILFGASEMVVYLTVVPISHKLRRKSTVILTCLIGLVGSGILIPISDFMIPEPSAFVKILRTLVSGLLVRIVSCINYAFIFGYAAELFPTNIRALMCGLATYVGRLSGAISPQIVTLAIGYKLEPLVFCSFVSIPILLMSGYLKETLNKPLS